MAYTGNTPRTGLKGPVDSKWLCPDPNITHNRVNVFCRIRPLDQDNTDTCITVKNSSAVALNPKNSEPSNNKAGSLANREIHYIFKHVFEETASQKDVFKMVAKPLVEDLIRGENSLLFTYGVSGSGKTFTMTGSARRRGIMPRCLELLFSSINEFQASEFIFKPDRMNGFEILSEEEAAAQAKEAKSTKTFQGNSKAFFAVDTSDLETVSSYSSALSKTNSSASLTKDNMYAVFVTYIEVYNNTVYDLLEETVGAKPLQQKIVREDANKNMYVHGVKEVEVKSVEQAMEAFLVGQKRKRIAQTVMNVESSRSHSVFNIRLVQAPVKANEDDSELHNVKVSQLSLVDLAGTERSSRTNNTGVRFKEACNINSSLMSLRNCFQLLRTISEGSSGGNSLQTKQIPYRDTKITLLFKNFFTGEGRVSMIVCVNPRAQDYDENLHVLKFAEKTQEVTIAKATPIKPWLNLVSDRRKVQNQKPPMPSVKAKNPGKLPMNKENDFDSSLKSLDNLMNQLPEVAEKCLDNAQDDYKDLQNFLGKLIKSKKSLASGLKRKMICLNSLIQNMQKEAASFSMECGSHKSLLVQEQARCKLLYRKVANQEMSINHLKREIQNKNQKIEQLTKQLNIKQQQQDNLMAHKKPTVVTSGRIFNNRPPLLNKTDSLAILNKKKKAPITATILEPFPNVSAIVSKFETPDFFKKSSTLRTDSPDKSRLSVEKKPVSEVKRQEEKNAKSEKVQSWLELDLSEEVFLTDTRLQSFRNGKQVAPLPDSLKMRRFSDFGF